MPTKNPTLEALVPYSRSHNPEIFSRIYEVLLNGAPEMYRKVIDRKEYEAALLNFPLRQAYVAEYSWQGSLFVMVKEENGSGMMMYRNGLLVMVFATELSEDPFLVYRRQ
jgi:hypothetical protein